jgi:hypothetical protein
MPRRSSRLQAKKRIDYGEDALWYRALGKGKDAWNEMIEVVADDPPPVQKPWQKKKLFQKKKPKKPVPKIKKKLVKIRSKIEKDEAEIDFPDTPEQRVDRILSAKGAAPKRYQQLQNISKKRKHLLFMNPGDVPIQAAMLAINANQVLPAWASPFRNMLGLNAGRLTWTEAGVTLPFAMHDDKRDAVKKLYFDPREPATIRPIAEKLYEVWANINRRNVRLILQSLETYQLNRGRRRPPDIKNRMFMKAPGMLAMDMFFPSVNLGWEKTNVLCCMDTWSRYCGVYVLDTKKLADVFKGMQNFLTKFASFGHMPRRILADKGSDLAAATRAIEPYRQARDGQKPMVLHTATGTPVLIIEALNAQVQRRMQVFRTSELIDSASQIAHEIADQINNQPRRDRGNLTPIQLLQLDAAGRNAINMLYRDKTVSAEVPGLRPLFVNDTVRVLKMTRKEQEQNKIKGFAPKWSKRLYTVLRKTKLRKNAFVFRYDVGLPDTYYRHELQKITGGRVDKVVPNQYVRYKEVVIGGYNPIEDEAGW